MVKRSKEQWQALIDEQSSSGQSAAEFCKERGINDGYFSTVKYKLKKAKQTSPKFVQVTSRASIHESVLLEYKGIKIRLPQSADPDWLASLLRSLAS